jgi:hypothetical protein
VLRWERSHALPKHPPLRSLPREIKNLAYFALPPGLNGYFGGPAFNHARYPRSLQDFVDEPRGSGYLPARESIHRYDVQTTAVEHLLDGARPRLARHLPRWGRFVIQKAITKNFFNPSLANGGGFYFSHGRQPKKTHTTKCTTIITETKTTK